MPKHTMTYADYLEEWELRFEDADKMEYPYWVDGNRHIARVHRLSETEFNEHLKALNAASDAFDKAFAADDGKGMDKALAESFQHELALLI